MATLRTPQISGEVLATPEEITQAQESFEPRRVTLGRQLSDRSRELEVIRKSDAELAETESLQKSGVKQAGVRATEDYVKNVERQQEEYRNKISANPLPTHKPTQEDLSTYAQIGSAMMTMGLMLGAGGKANAKLGMDAMTGMMNGWRKGRQDLWKQEAVNFEKAFNKIKADRETIYKNLQEGLKLASTNYAASKEKLETAAYIAGEGSVLKKRIENRDFKGIADFNESIRKTENNLNDNIRKAAGSLAQVRQQKELAQMKIDAENLRKTGGGDDLKRQLQEARLKQINEQIARANRKAEEAGKNERPPAKEIVAQNTLRNNLLPKLETAIPVLDRLNKENNWGKLTSLLAIDSRAAEFAFRNDPEALNLILTLAYFRSKEFETAGKALTRKEDQILAPIVRGDLRVYEGIRNAMVDAQKTLSSEQKGLENIYPYIKKVNDAFRKEMSGGSEDRFEVGKIYTDSDGNKAKYLGNGQWEEQ